MSTCNSSFEIPICIAEPTSTCPMELMSRAELEEVRHGVESEEGTVIFSIFLIHVLWNSPAIQEPSSSLYLGLKELHVLKEISQGAYGECIRLCGEVQ